MTDFKQTFLSKEIGSTVGGKMLFTQEEFDAALTVAKAEIMTVAIETTKKALSIEREECAKIAEEWGHEDCARAIRHRLSSSPRKADK